MIVAEIGCNHMGDFELCKKMILSAKERGAHAIKLQKRTPSECLTVEQYIAPHPVPHNAYGETYGKHREFLEFDVPQHQKLKEYCESINIIYSTSVWDKTSAEQIIALNPEYIKVGSPSNLHFEMMQVLRDGYGGEVHISLGMTTDEELDKIMKFWEGHHHRLVLYACTSGYPVDHGDVYLFEITRLKHKYGTAVKAIGFSGHHLGIAIDMAAVALGATWIERHFTLDRTWKGTDHAASLEPSGLEKLCRDACAVAMALQKKPSEMSTVELSTRKKLKYGT